MLLNLFFFFLFVPFIAFSQENMSEKNEHTKQVGYFYSPDYTVGVFDWSYGYATGFHFLKSFNNNFAIDFGIGFSSRNDVGVSLIFPSYINPQTGNVDTISDYTHKYQFIEFPVKIKFSVLQKEKLQLYVTGGMSMNYFLRNVIKQVYYRNNGEFIKRTEIKEKNMIYNPVVLSYLFGSSMEFNFFKRWSFILEPEFRVYLLSLFGKLSIGGYIYAVGVNGGVIYNF